MNFSSQTEVGNLYVFEILVSTFPGTCEDKVNGFICGCEAGFSGIRCEEDIDDCQPSPCEHGVYLRGDNYILRNIRHPRNKSVRIFLKWDAISSLYSRRGNTSFNSVEISHSLCSLPVKYMLDQCFNKVQIDFVCNFLLNNNCSIFSVLPFFEGICADLVNNYTCSCNVGFTGRDCDIVVTRCTADSCFPNVTCSKKGHTIACDPCPLGFTGDGKNCKGNTGLSKAHTFSSLENQKPLWVCKKFNACNSRPE